MRVVPAAAAALLVLAAPRARAEGDERPEVVLALRLAVAPAFGSAVQDVPMSDAVGFQVPVQLDAMVRRRSVSAGLYLSRGWGRVESCDGSCGAAVWRAGLQATVDLAPIRGAEPWAGVSAGYEWASLTRSRAGTEVETRWRGWELFAAQGGVEWRVARSAAVGPFVLVGVGRYTDMAVDTGLADASASIPHRAIHGWIQAGVRARLALGDGR